MACEVPAVSGPMPRPPRKGWYVVTKGKVEVPADGNFHDVLYAPPEDLAGTFDGDPLTDRVRVQIGASEVDAGKNGTAPFTLTVQLLEGYFSDGRTNRPQTLITQAHKTFNTSPAVAEKAVWWSGAADGYCVRVMADQPVLLYAVVWVDWAYGPPGLAVWNATWTIDSNLKTA